MGASVTPLRYPPYVIQAIVFDLYETLITETHVPPTRASSLGPALGLDPTAYRPAWKARRPRVITGELSFADALIEISQALTGRADAAAIQDICEQRVREKAPAFARIDDGITTLVAECTRTGVQLGVISNGFKEDVLLWPACALAPSFRSTAFSCDERVAKPAPDIYRRALDRLGVRPENAMYVGDGGDHELTGAEQAGLRAYRATWFANHAALAGAWPELERPQEVLRRLQQ